MKIVRLTHLTFILLITLGLPISCFAQGWTSQTSGTTNYLSGVKFIDFNNGWVVGSAGTIIHTTNGGVTWGNQVSGSTCALYSVTFLDLSTGWVVGDSGKILHTTNGGTTWSNQTSGTLNELVSVSFSDPSHGWTAGSAGTILHTTNGGVAWINQHPPLSSSDFLYGITCIDSSNCFTAGANNSSSFAHMGHTSNSGVNWGFIVNFNIAGYHSVSFCNPDTGFALGFGDYRYPWSEFYKTVDGGGTWTYQASFSYCKGMSATDVNNAWAVGDYGVIVHTSNGGVSWNTQSSGTIAYFTGVNFISQNNGWAVGSGGTILHTTTGGTGVTDNTNGNLPDRFSLRQNYPNPFNSSTTISYGLPKSGDIELKIFDLNGRVVNSLFKEYQHSGYYRITFDGKGLSSGTYFYRLSNGHQTATQKMILVK